MLKFTFVIALFFLSLSNSFSQNNQWMLFKTEGDTSIKKETQQIIKEGVLNIDSDPRIQVLSAQMSSNPSYTKVKRFRIQLFFDQNLKSVQRTRNDFEELFPEVKTFIDFSSPNHRLRAGNFKTKLAAKKFQKELENQYTGTSIITESVQP